jgi:hypothetical protein
MPWTYKAKRDALFLLAVVVPGLMLGLGLGGYYLTTFLGLGGYSDGVAVVGTTAGLIASLFVALKLGEKYEKTGEGASP